MNNIQKIILSSIVVFLLVSQLVFTQDVGSPITEEEAKKIREDFLLDIPISNDQAVDSAQQEIQTGQEPIYSGPAMYIDPSETKGYRLAWNITFGDPENKEVLVDAINGTVLSVRSTKPTLKAKTIEVFQNPVYLFMILIAILIVLVGIFLLKRRKTLTHESKS